MATRNKIQSALYDSWLKETEKRAADIDMEFNVLESMIRDMPTLMLHYLIHYNNGGPSYSPLVTLYEAEVKRRGEPYTAEIGEMVESELSV